MRSSNRPKISTHNGPWSDAALVVDAIANGGAARLVIAAYGFKSDDAWAKEMRRELEQLMRRAPSGEKGAG